MKINHELTRIDTKAEGGQRVRVHSCLFVVVLFALVAFSSSSSAGEPFLQGFDNFIPVDSGSDASGNTYILSQAGAIKKLDPAGLELNSTNWPPTTNVLAANATAL